MVSHRAFGYVKCTSEFAGRRPGSAHRQDLSFARSQRILAFTERRHGKLRIDDPLACGRAADRVHQYGGGRVLEDESNRTLIQRAPKVAWAAKNGEHQDMAAWQAIVQLA